MGQDFFEYLPSEIITDILARLPIRSIAISKCVRKSWLDLLKNDEFGKFYLSRSAAALAVLTPEENSSRCAFFELEDEIDAESSHDHHYNHLTKFTFPHGVTIKGSANGMLLLRKYGQNAVDLYVCNPITREYIELEFPKEFFVPQEEVIYGFGASRITGQHKVVRIIPEFDCHVYTFGTGSWRRVEEPDEMFCYDISFHNASVNGNLHWIVKDLSNDITLISCFDLETECFSTFSVPPLEGFIEMCAFKDCVCLCDNMEDENIIWLMKEYGDEKSWTKEYVINAYDSYGEFIHVYAIKVFKDGDILVILDTTILSYYSNKTETFQEIGIFDSGNALVNSMLYTPSFLSLKSFGMGNVISF